MFSLFKKSVSAKDFADAIWEGTRDWPEKYGSALKKDFGDGFEKPFEDILDEMVYFMGFSTDFALHCHLSQNPKIESAVRDVFYKDESYKIVGACFEVYREKGCGFLEAVYQECMEIELRLQGIPYVPKKPLALEYKGCPLRSTYEPDFICYEKIVLELKAVAELADEHRAQVQNYLKATGLKLGLLVNFGHFPKAQVERIVAERGRYENKDRN
jgi:GxxExxY protein